MWVKSPILLDE